MNKRDSKKIADSIFGVADIIKECAGRGPNMQVIFEVYARRILAKLDAANINIRIGFKSAEIALTDGERSKWAKGINRLERCALLMDAHRCGELKGYKTAQSARFFTCDWTDSEILGVFGSGINATGVQSLLLAWREFWQLDFGTDFFECSPNNRPFSQMSNYGALLDSYLLSDTQKHSPSNILRVGGGSGGAMQEQPNNKRLKRKIGDLPPHFNTGYTKKQARAMYTILTKGGYLSKLGGLQAFYYYMGISTRTTPKRRLQWLKSVSLLAQVVSGCAAGLGRNNRFNKWSITARIFERGDGREITAGRLAKVFLYSGGKNWGEWEELREKITKKWV